MKSLKWPLTATTLTEKQATRIIQPIVTSGLKASGTPTCMDRCIIYSPVHLMGLAVRNLYISQGIAHVHHLLDNGHKEMITGQLIRATYEQLVVETGLPGDIFAWKYASWDKMVTKSWIQHTWKFCSENGLTNHAPTTHALKLRRENDEFKMPKAVQNGFQDSQLARINRCRMFLRVVTISDIATMAGDEIRAAITNGTRDNLPPVNITWPNQYRPTANDWYEWKRFLQLLTRPTSWRLITPVQAWIKNPNHWESFWHETTDSLYLRHGQ